MVIAPPTQSHHSSGSFLVCCGRGVRVALSVICIRPFGFNTLEISEMVLVLSKERLMTQLEITTSTELSGRGMSSISPWRKVALVMSNFSLLWFASFSMSMDISRP